MRWLDHALRQVPNLEVFELIDGEEFAHARCEPCVLIAQVLRSNELLLEFGVCQDFGLVEVEQTPLDLRYRALALVVPDCDGCGILFVKDAADV